MAREVGYDNVGTWEWIVTPDGRPFLMEVNTRIQVENGVSAVIASIDGRGETNLIAEQIRLGLGEEAGYTQENVKFEGVGIEYRIIAEDPPAGFVPWSGRIDQFEWPEHEWLKMHTHVRPPYDIPTEYDPNMALAIIWGKDLDEAKSRGIEVLDNLTISGRDSAGSSIRTNVEFLKYRTANLLEF
jgi:acetyl/propionyl-CoA carboxylase alpha subunit